MFSFTNRIVLFFSLMLVFLLGLYGIGTAQQFLDGTFLLVARVGAGCAISLVMVLLFAFFELLLYTATSGSTGKLWYLALYAVALLLALVSGGFFSVLLAL